MPAADVLLMINPESGRGAGRRLGPEIQHYLSEQGVSSLARFSPGPGEITKEVETACIQGWEHIVVAGGDGSIYEAVNGLMRSGVDLPLGIIPLGTGNDFVKTFGVPTAWRAAANCVTAAVKDPAQRVRIDVGRCNDVFFINAVGLGLDADIADAANRIRWLRGRLVYVAALLGVLRKPISAPHIALEIDGRAVEGDMCQVSVCNGGTVGGMFRMAPAAELDDGLFDVVYANRLSRFGALRLAPKVIRGTHIGAQGVHTVRASKLSLTADRPMPLQADGEIISTGIERLEVEVLPERLCLLGRPQV